MSNLRSLPRPADVAGLSTAALRSAFLVEELFASGNLVFSDCDRLTLAGFTPREPITLQDAKETGRVFFHEARESGVINIGGPGAIEVDGTRHALAKLDCLYISMGTRSVRFLSDDAANPASFFFLSCPAHRAYPTTLATIRDCNVLSLGTPESANVRKIYQFIHEGGVQSCQLVMGFTELAPGSVWNTFPPHTHLRRSEAYLYFDLTGPIVMHFMGDPAETRHLVVREREAVLSPPWSIHSGCGAGAYKFIWGMAGENKAFADMDAVDLKEMR
jgi:4-deoxy-L-threo-5-hexosulose-uronate ketol-isomerase